MKINFHHPTLIENFEYAEIASDENEERRGTLLYSAPEILNGSPYSYNSDMWSVGVSMTVLLTHLIPFYGKRKEQILKEIFRRRITLPRKFSEEAQDLLDKLLCIDPKDRILAAEALQHPWFNDVEELKDDAQNPEIDEQSNN